MNFRENLKKSLKNLGIKRGQTIVLNIDLLKTIIFLKKKKIQFNIEDVIEPIKEIVSKNGNIIVYSFF